MKLPPLWKIKRELRRIGPKTLGAARFLYEYFTERRHFDNVLARQIRVISGDLPATDRIAIYLIFPQIGVQRSHIRSLNWITEAGYAPLVISNQPLSEDDLRLLGPHAWQILERPNFGYDIGGYRTGVLHISERLQSLSRLVFLNDSCWFPVTEGANWLTEAEENGADFVGACSHWGYPHIAVDAFEEIAWTFDDTHRNFHYGSFALSVGPAVLQNEKFLGFWQKYRLTNHKSRTVRRGETGLTKWVQKRGFRHSATLDLSTLDVELQELPHERLLFLAQRLIAHEDWVLRDKKKEILQGEGRNESRILRQFILSCIARQGPGYALPSYMIAEKKFPFLKKNPLWAAEETRLIMQDVIAEIPGEIGEEIRTEAAEIIAARAKASS